MSTLAVTSDFQHDVVLKGHEQVQSSAYLLSLHVSFYKSLHVSLHLPHLTLQHLTLPASHILSVGQYLQLASTSVVPLHDWRLWHAMRMDMQLS